MEIDICEVGPRDGLQNEKVILSTDLKIKLIEQLIDCGFRHIEATSFVSPKYIPQMSDSLELYQKIQKNQLTKKCRLTSLVPNLKGLENAKKANCQSLAFFTATSEKFTKKNMNMSVKQSLKLIEEMRGDLDFEKIKTRAYISTVFDCPYEGKMNFKKTFETIEFFLNLGVKEISLGDTIGSAVPKRVRELVKQILENFDPNHFWFHFHDTRGMGVSNVLTCLERGIKQFDSSISGLGGCPYAQGASGNVATEELIMLFESEGIETGIDLEKVLNTARFINSALGKTQTSKFLKASK